MLIEIHLLQNHGPSNPNRDDLGAPKTAWFGGRLRGRISSQCLKRSIRWWPEFRTTLQGKLGTRTKIFPDLVRQELEKLGSPVADAAERARIVEACKNIARAEQAEKPERGKKADLRPKTPQLVFLQPGHVEEFVKRVGKLRTTMREEYDYFCNPQVAYRQVVQARLEERQADEKEAKAIVGKCWLIATQRKHKLFENLEEKPVDWNDERPEPAQLADWLLDLGESNPQRLKELLKKEDAAEAKQGKESQPETPKAYKRFTEALFLPMRLNAVDIALFGRMTTSEAFEDVEAAVEVAHAISTNALQQEVDYFTAIDDEALPGTGAGHLGENQFNSCTYYKYFSLDWNGLVNRLADPQQNASELAETRKLAANTVKAFILAACHAVPTGKKKSHANNDPVSALLVEVKTRRIPTSYANAFVKPAAPTKDQDLIGDSITKLGQYVGCTAQSYGVRVARRLWHAARGERLEHVRPNTAAAAREAEPVPDTTTLASIDEVVRETLAAIDVALAAQGAAS